jgi:anti-sigma regulatory factor (Ser/Thr protein kinase)
LSANEIRLTQKNTFEDFLPLSRRVSEFLTANDVPQNVIFAAELALEELVTNTLKYGYDDEDEHEIEVVARIDEEAMTLVVGDDGHEFDPLAADEPDVTAPAEEREIGGLGIFLLRKSMTDLRYERIGGRNVVTAVKAFGER